MAGGGSANTPEPVDVASLLGTIAIPPGPDGITTEVVLDTVADPETFSVNYALSGRSADGLPVVGTFSVMKPPPVPTAENSRPITDPVLKAKILAARKLLAKAVVNDDDIAMLERAGKLDDLRSASPAATAASSSPSGAERLASRSAAATAHPAGASRSADAADSVADNQAR